MPVGLASADNRTWQRVPYIQYIYIYWSKQHWKRVPSVIACCMYCRHTYQWSLAYGYGARTRKARLTESECEGKTKRIEEHLEKLYIVLVLSRFGKLFSLAHSAPTWWIPKRFYTVYESRTLHINGIAQPTDFQYILKLCPGYIVLWRVNSINNIYIEYYFIVN